MFISPKQAINEGWITHPNCTDLNDWTERKFVSPNAIDFTLDHLFSINENNMFVFSEEGKQMRGGEKQIPIEARDGSGGTFWAMNARTVYDGMSDMHVTVPNGVACTLIVRSTLNRNGIFITSGVYDQGFDGSLGFAIHNRSGIAKIAPGTRVGQIIFHKSDDSGISYEGGYNTEKGQHWKDAAL